jgi:hypothetical protein
MSLITCEDPEQGMRVSRGSVPHEKRTSDIGAVISASLNMCYWPWFPVKFSIRRRIKSLPGIQPGLFFGLEFGFYEFQLSPVVRYTGVDKTGSDFSANRDRDLNETA